MDGASERSIFSTSPLPSSRSACCSGFPPYQPYHTHTHIYLTKPHPHPHPQHTHRSARRLLWRQFLGNACRCWVLYDANDNCHFLLCRHFLMKQVVQIDKDTFMLGLYAAPFLSASLLTNPPPAFQIFFFFFFYFTSTSLLTCAK